MPKLLRTMVLIASLAYAMSLALPSGAGAAVSGFTATSRQVIAGHALKLSATTTSKATCRLTFHSRGIVEKGQPFTAKRRRLAWTVAVSRSAAGGRWTAVLSCQGHAAQSTSVLVVSRGHGRLAARINAPAQSGASFTSSSAKPAPSGTTTTTGKLATPKITWGPLNGVITRSTTAKFDFDGADAFQCRLDKGSFTSCNGTVSYNGLAAGVHAFSVRAVDTASGQVSDTADTAWTVNVTKDPFPADQCTSWAYQKRPDVWDSSALTPGSWNAYAWVDHARAVGYTVDTHPQQGDLAVWGQNVHGTGATGHVAYVESVNDDGTITVSETGGVYGSTPHTSTYSADGLLFIHQHA